MPSAILGSWGRAMNSVVGDPWPGACILVRRQMSTVVSEEDRDGERGLSGEVTFECRSEGYKPGRPMDIKAIGRRSGNSFAHSSYIAFIGKSQP